MGDAKDILGLSKPGGGHSGPQTTFNSALGRPAKKEKKDGGRSLPEGISREVGLCPPFTHSSQPLHC